VGVGMREKKEGGNRYSDGLEEMRKWEGRFEEED